MQNKQEKGLDRSLPNISLEITKAPNNEIAAKLDEKEEVNKRETRLAMELKKNFSKLSEI